MSDEFATVVLKELRDFRTETNKRFDNLEENISAFLENSKEMTEKERVEARYQRFRSM